MILGLIVDYARLPKWLWGIHVELSALYMDQQNH